MPSFFRDNSMAFKPRSNIFSKLRVNENDDVDKSTEGKHDQSGEDGIFKSVDEDLENDNTDNTSIGEQDLNKIKNISLQTNQSSTPKSLNKKEFHQRYKPVSEEDELEITEVRSLDSNLNQANKSLPEHHSNTEEEEKSRFDEEHGETSSNDVLLEAFTNTQKICTSLKQELQKQQRENSKLKSQLQSLQNDSSKFVDIFSGYKNNLASLEERCKWFLEQKQLNDKQLKDLKHGNSMFCSKIKTYNKDVEQLKNSIVLIKKHSHELDNELSKKTKEIDYLKRELDDCSGQLSEEKLKNSSLVSELTTIRNQIFESTKSVEKNNSEMMNAMSELIPNSLSNIVNSFKTEQFKSLTSYINRTEESLAGNVKSEISLATEKICDAAKVNGHEVLTSFNTTINEKMTAAHDNQTNSLYELFEKIKVQLESENVSCSNKFTDEIKNVSVDVSRLVGEINEFKAANLSIQNAESKMESLKYDLSELQLQKVQHLSQLGTKEAELEDLTKRNLGLETTLKNLQEKSAINDTNIMKLEKEIEFKKTGILRMEEAKTMLISNYENKLAAQIAINSTNNSECEMLRKRVEELEKLQKEGYDESAKQMEKFQKYHEQISKLNVELVQLKARELELDEENRGLKQMAEDEKLGQEEVSNEIKRFKQKIITLESGKQDLVSEKLDLLDRVEQLEKTVKKLDSENAKLVQEKKATQKHEIISNLNTVVESDSVPQKQEPRKKKSDNDEFELSSSLNDDLEMTVPSPIEIQQMKRGKSGTQSMRAPGHSRKKLLLSDEDDGLKAGSKKRRNRGFNL